MKITSVEPLTCHSGIAGRDWLFIKVTTDEGIVGWGEGYDWRAAPALAAAVRLVGKEVIGQDPRSIDSISRRLRAGGGAGVRERMTVIAALDLALYDIKGKWLGVPVYDLIGGLYRERIPLYRSGFVSRRDRGADAPPAEDGGAPVDWLARADEVERSGFRALKIDLQSAGLRTGVQPTLDGAFDRRLIATAVEIVGTLRGRCGPDMGIMLDLGQEYRTGGIVQLARALESLDLYWLEVDGLDADGLLAARQQTRTRICHGKALIGRHAYRAFLEQHVTDVVAIETLSNGLSESRRIAELVAHYDAMFSPPNDTSPLSTMIKAHLCAVMPNCEILEIGLDEGSWAWQLIDHPPRIERGELIVPDRPGWGADVVEEEVARHPVPGHAGGGSPSGRRR